jgi:N-acetylmuramoyl-L-alanine amidase
MKVIINLLIVITFLLPSSLVAKEKEKVTKRGELYGLVVIIDPGHGGTDPGAQAVVDSKPVNEDENCYDVASRLKRMTKDKDAIVFMTTYDTKQLRPIANSPTNMIPPDCNERFALDDSVVKAKTEGASRRVAYANLIKKKYPKHEIVFISIHFDVLPKKMEGVRIIESAAGTKVGGLLAKSFSDGNRMENGVGSLFKSGDKSHGIVNAYVLRADKNTVKGRVLVELGNFSNIKDLWRIRDYKVRENYAQLITRALIEMMKGVRKK